MGATVRTSEPGELTLPCYLNSQFQALSTPEKLSMEISLRRC